MDASGSAYVTGNTSSPDFPTTAGSLQPAFGGSSDAYVTKLDSTGSELVYSTYLGGMGGEVGTAIFVDVAGGAFVAGNTSSGDFPTTALAFQTEFGGNNDAFVTRLNPAGSALAYSTYLGGTDVDIAGDIVVDATGNAYVTGGTASEDFPTTVGAFQTTYAGDHDAFVTKLNLLGSTLLYSTYLGGSGPANDFGGGIAVDADGSAYVAGSTWGVNFPTTPLAFQPNPHDPDPINRDVFVSKLNPTGSALVYSTYLGGSGFDDLNQGGIVVDSVGNAYVSGFTQSEDFPTTLGAFQNDLGGEDGLPDAFVTKLNTTGSGLVYSTYLGGSEVEESLGIAIDTMGNAYILGRTASTDFPITAGAFQNDFAGAEDAFVAKLNQMGSDLVYSSYLGGSQEDTNNGDIVVDESVVDPIVYVAGTTDSDDFPTTEGAFDTTFGDPGDAYVAQIVDTVLPPTPTADRVKGSGTVNVPGGTGRFHLIVTRQTDGTLAGKVQYVNRVTDAKMKSESIASLVITGNNATINGSCGTFCTFTVDVTDNSSDGSTDTFTISINGGPPEGGTLQKGNIQIQQQ